MVQQQMSSKGSHVLIDIINFTTTSQSAWIIFDLMKRVIRENSKMKIVNEAITVFNDNDTDSEAGWTSCLLLDASHFSSHAYSNRGMMAFDLFTCKNDTDENDPLEMMEVFIYELRQIYDGDFDIIYKECVDRFHF